MSYINILYGPALCVYCLQENSSLIPQNNCGNQLWPHPEKHMSCTPTEERDMNESASHITAKMEARHQQKRLIPPQLLH